MAELYKKEYIEQPDFLKSFLTSLTGKILGDIEAKKRRTEEEKKRAYDIISKVIVGQYGEPRYYRPKEDISGFLKEQGIDEKSSLWKTFTDITTMFERVTVPTVPTVPEGYEITGFYKDGTPMIRKIKAEEPKEPAEIEMERIKRETAVERLKKMKEEKIPKEKELTAGQKTTVSQAMKTLENMYYTTKTGKSFITSREKAEDYLQGKGIDINKFPEYKPYFENILSAYDKLPEEAKAGPEKLWFTSRKGEAEKYLLTYKPILQKNLQKVGDRVPVEELKKRFIYNPETDTFE